MIKYAQIINEQTKQCEVGMGTNAEFYRSVGMTEMEVEQAYDGAWYVKGYTPEKPIEELQAEVRAIRNSYLKQYVDSKQLVLVWNNLNEDDKKLYADYRTYLLDYTKLENWWLNNPMTFDEWNGNLSL